jgi:hypothetical protein
MCGRAYFNTIFSMASSLAAAFMISKSVNGGASLSLGHAQASIIAGGT